MIRGRTAEPLDTGCGTYPQTATSLTVAPFWRSCVRRFEPGILHSAAKPLIRRLLLQRRSSARDGGRSEICAPSGYIDSAPAGLDGPSIRFKA